MVNISFWGNGCVRLLELKPAFHEECLADDQGLESRNQKEDPGNRARFIDMHNSQWLHCRRHI